MPTSSARSEFPADFRAGEPSAEPPKLHKRGALTRILITFCAGVAATLAWQSYGDTAREIIANSYPQLGWLAPQAAVAQTAPGTSTINSPDPQELKTISLDIAALRQTADQLAARQDQTTRDITAKLQAVEQDILEKISALPPQPAAAPARKPVPPPLQLAPAR